MRVSRAAVLTNKGDDVDRNMNLWRKVFTTDPSAVKPISGKAYKGNSPKPFWLIEQATRVFGPVGIGWGITVKSERFERVTETDVLHVAIVSVWYVWEGVRSETFDQMGGTKAAYMSKNGMVVDEDAGKKSITDGMVKCLSMIGFAGDIFSGRWDDSKYVAQAGREFAWRAEVEQFAEDHTLSTERAEIVMLAADRAIELHEKGDDMGAYEQYESLANNEEKLACWSRLRPHSAVRSAIKAVGKNQRPADAGEPHAAS